MVKRKSIITPVILLVLFLLFTVSLKFIDVRSVGPEGSMVGYATINKNFFDYTGVNEIFDKLSDMLAAVSILIGIGYAFAGLYQLVKRKSLLKVDKDLYVFAIFLVAMVIIYVIFEFVVINYRPILEEGQLEASYPSSHTMLTLCVCGYAIAINRGCYYKWKQLSAVNYICVFVITLTLVSRLFSGVHWLSDIVGSVLISSALISFFVYFISVIHCPRGDGDYYDDDEEDED